MDDLIYHLNSLREIAATDPSIYYIVFLLILVSSIPYAISAWCAALMSNIQKRGFFISWGAVLFNMLTAITLLFVFIWCKIELDLLALLGMFIVLEIIVYWFSFSTSIRKAALLALIQAIIIIFIAIVAGLFIHFTM